VVDRQVMEGQESDRAVSVQLRRGFARLLPTDESINQSFTCEQHAESQEHSPKVKNVPPTL
jgi:hypothetical protein